MKPIDPDAILRQLAAEDREEGAAVPADELLEAYRAGRLPGEEARKLETALAESPAAWRRLAGLARLEPAAAPPAVRERVLERLPSPSWRRRWMLAAAAVLAAAALGLAALRFLDRETTAGLPPPHQVRIAALATDRSGPQGATAATAYPETRVEIEAMAEVAEQGLAYGLYRLSAEGRLERLRTTSEGGRLRLEVYRGAAMLSARAADLVGTAPAEHRLYLVVARGGGLPDEVAPAPGEGPVAALAAVPGRQVHPLSLQMLPAP